ncbi:MAG: YicC family protein [Bacteroidetes bacterium]|nr:YicC family protein [Bacteroidota bacterium]
MLQSMTGFGKATGTFKGKKISIEIRALNSKGMDLTVRTHHTFRELESGIRKMVTDALERGKVDVNLFLEDAGESTSVRLNQALVKSYYDDLKAANDALGEESKDYLSMIVRLPEVYTTEKEVLTTDEKDWVMNLAQETCNKLQEFREQEGAALKIEFIKQIEGIRQLMLETAPFEAGRVEIVRQRMEKQLEEIKTGSYDANRLEQELIFYMEKFDVSEEKMRLTNHLDYFLQTMEEGAIGRKLGFICQEIGREINTLGSKCNHAEMQKKVVDMKDHLEKIKEQVLNTL